MYSIKDFHEYMDMDKIVGKDLLVWSRELGYHFLEAGSDVTGLTIVGVK